MCSARRGIWSALALVIVSSSAILSGGIAAATVTSSTHISTDAISALSCPTSTFCAAGDAAGDVYVEVSGVWSTATLLDLGSAIDAVSCTSATFCVAGDTNGNVYLFDGTAWGVGSQPDGSSINAISCNATSCTAVTNNGNALRSIDGGVTWSVLGGTMPDGNALVAVSCPSSGFCEVSDNANTVFLYLGGPWTAPTAAFANAVTGISCPTTSFCEAVDADGDVFTSEGINWVAYSLNPLTTQSPSEISCPSASFCLLGDGSGNVFVDRSGTWNADPTNPVDLGGTITAVSCASAISCALGDGAGNVLTYSPPSLPRPPAPVLQAQSPLTVTSVKGVVGSGLVLTTSGGSGMGAVSFVVDSAGSAGCVASATGVLSATAAGTCSVSATKSSDGVYAQVTSLVTTVTFVSAATTPPPVRKVASRKFVVGPFANGSASLERSLVGQASRVFALSMREGYRTLIVTGYASAIGPYGVNVALSRARAEAVAALLRKDCARDHYRVSFRVVGAGVGTAPRAAANRVVDVTARIG